MLRECSPPQTCHVSRVTCHMSRVTCHVSHVTCHVSHFFYFFFLQSGEASQGRVCYQRGLPRLVSCLYQDYAYIETWYFSWMQGYYPCKIIFPGIKLGCEQTLNVVISLFVTLLYSFWYFFGPKEV